MSSLPIKESTVYVAIDDEEFSRLARALGHPVRVAIVRYLNSVEGCFCGKLTGQLPLAQSTISQHLKKLKEAGWIRGTVDGPRTCYCLNSKVVERFHSLLQNL